MADRINGFKVSIYKEGNGWTGVIDLGLKPDGKRDRPKRKGPTVDAVMEKLAELAREIKEGAETSDESEPEHTVLDAVNVFMKEFRKKGKAPGTVLWYEAVVRNHISEIGHIKLRELTPFQVAQWLDGVSERVSSETLRKVHGVLSRVIDKTIIYEMVERNVSRLVDNVQGVDTGRESKSFTPEQVQVILRAASAVSHRRFGAYVIFALTTGLRVDEIHGLLWESLDLDARTVSVVRAARHKEKTKTEESIRTLDVGEVAVKALKIWRRIQALEFEALGRRVTKKTPVFTREDGTAYTAATARPEFRCVLKAAGIGNPQEWTLRETRTTFVSIMSHNGVPREQIADMCGHTVRTLERHYRKVLRPVHRQGAEVIDRVFSLAA